MVKARKTGLAGPVEFSPAQTKHVEAFQKALEQRFRRFEREKAKALKEEADKLLDMRLQMALGHEVSLKIKDRLIAHAKRKEAAFTVDEYRLLLKGLQANPSDETRKLVGQLLNERAIFATGGQWGKKPKAEADKVAP